MPIPQLINDPITPEARPLLIYFFLKKKIFTNYSLLISIVIDGLLEK